jgi:hypothetical protein
MKQLTALGQGAVLPKIVGFGGSGVNHPHNMPVVTKKVTLSCKTKALLHFFVYESSHTSMTMSKFHVLAVCDLFAFLATTKAAWLPPQAFAQSHEKCLKVLFHVFILLQPLSKCS